MAGQLCVSDISNRIGLVVSAVITGIVLLAISFSGLEDYEVGLLYKPISKGIDEGKLYTGGTHFVGPGN